MSALDIEGDDRVYIQTIYSKSNPDLPKLKFTHTDDDYDALVSLTGKDGVELLKPTVVSDFCCLVDAFTKDFNRDGEPDFVLILHSVMNGLGGYHRDVVFVLSEKQGYVTKTIRNSHEVEKTKDFVSLKRDGSCQFVHTEMEILDSNDGRKHSHWIYNLLEIDGTNFKPANRLLPSFPKFVWFTTNPNTKRTRFISKEFQLKWIYDNFENIFFSEKPIE